MDDYRFLVSQLAGGQDKQTRQEQHGTHAHTRNKKDTIDDHHW